MTQLPNDLKAVLFDMDGVLFDSMPYHAQSWCMLFEELGIVIPPTLPFLHEGRTGEGFIKYVMEEHKRPPLTVSEMQYLYDRKCELFNALSTPPIMAGALEAVHSALNNGWRCTIVTGSGQRSLLNKINLNFPNCFDTSLLVTANDVTNGKPSPEPYLMGLQKLGVQPYEAIVVENAPLGVKSGVAAGIYTIAVNTGPLSDACLTEAGAAVVLPDMKALANLFQSQQM